MYARQDIDTAEISFTTQVEGVHTFCFTVSAKNANLGSGIGSPRVGKKLREVAFDIQVGETWSHDRVLTEHLDALMENISSLKIRMQKLKRYGHGHHALLAMVNGSCMLHKDAVSTLRLVHMQPSPFQEPPTLTALTCLRHLTCLTMGRWLCAPRTTKASVMHRCLRCHTSCSDTCVQHRCLLLSSRLRMQTFNVACTLCSHTRKRDFTARRHHNVTQLCSVPRAALRRRCRGWPASVQLAIAEARTSHQLAFCPWTPPDTTSTATRADRLRGGWWDQFCLGGVS